VSILFSPAIKEKFGNISVPGVGPSHLVSAIHKTWGKSTYWGPWESLFRDKKALLRRNRRMARATESIDPE
jgi:hypothetical protein